MKESENRIMYKLKKVKLDYDSFKQMVFTRRINDMIRTSNKWYLVNEPKLKGFGIYEDFHAYRKNEELFYLFCSKSNIRSNLNHYMGLNKEDMKILEKNAEIIHLSFWESCNLIVKKTILTQSFYLKFLIEREIYKAKHKLISIEKKINLIIVSIIIQLITLFFILLLLKGVGQ